MQLESVRELKASLFRAVIDPLTESVAKKATLGVAAQPMSAAGAKSPTIALGVIRKAPNDFKLAVRIQKRSLESGRELDAITKQAKGEVDVRYIGTVKKLAGLPWHQKRSRPLKIGVSIGHANVTAGTLGAFVRGREAGSPIMVLSNNHVLADENRGKKGDAILQPGRLDGGEDPADRVATLERFVRLNKTKPNLIDAAVGLLVDGIEHDHRTLTGLGGKLAGLGDAVLNDKDAVGKVGRTTGTTRGRVVAFELDKVRVVYGADVLQFDGQVEIEGDGNDPFSDGGDSGSLIVDADRRGVALLFAASDQGGTNGKGLTYANPLRAVLDALKVDLHVS